MWDAKSMNANRWGQIFQLSTFGESHGPAMGALVEGCPAGVEFDFELLKKNLARRRPGQNSYVTSRDETDNPEVLSGIYQNKTLGTPICIVVRNENQRSEDYDQKVMLGRRGHAEDVWKYKYGHIDPRGGGRASGRETLARVIGGSLAEMFVRQSISGVRVVAHAASIGPIKLDSISSTKFSTEDIDAFSLRMPDAIKNKMAEDLLAKAKEKGESYGGRANLRIEGLPAGLGQPVFKKLKSELASAYMSLGAVVGVEFGAGFDAIKAEGTEFHQGDNDVYGGIRGGISTGEPVQFQIAFKPTSSVLDVAKKGRHDPCILPRAIPVLEAMTYLVLADQFLCRRLDTLEV